MLLQSLQVSFYSLILVDSPTMILRCCFFAVKQQTKSFFRAEPSDHAKTLLRKALRVEVEFYEFAKKRFYLQLEKLKSLKRISST